MRRVLLIAFLFTLGVLQGFSQCLTNVDFNTWSIAGNPANGNWNVISGGSQVHQTVNGNNTFFISPFELINVRITGNFRSEDGDDDWMGFVFSFLDPIGNTTNYNCWLFDWKRDNQGNNPRGMSLCKLSGVVNPLGSAFGDHIDQPGVFEVMQNDFGGIGWQKDYDHAFTLELTFTRAIIYVDGNLVFDQTDCFLPGYFGFYNRSQPDCYYSNFQYDLFIDFVVDFPQVCPGDQATFTFLDPCIQFNFNFNQYVSFTWDYGDGTVEVNNNPSFQNVNGAHIYNAPGTYNVTLTIEDTQGCTASRTNQITVLPGPTIDFTANTACQGSPTNFTDQSTGNPAFWEWQFEPGQPLDNNQNPSYTFPSAGTYTVTLTASENGCINTDTRDVTVVPSPTAAFSAASIPCSGLPVDLTDESTSDPGNAITTWEWDFDGDNVVDANTPDAIAIFPAPGNYTTSLTVTTANGCSDTYTEQIAVTESPVVDFAWTDACMNDGIVFDATASVNGGNITDYFWDYDGDQVPDDIIEDPTHIFATPGTHTVSLAVMADNGCPNYAQHDVNVFAEPTADFSFVNACAGNNIAFTDLSTVSAGNIVSWDWDFESDNVIDDNTQNPSFDYGGIAGQYDVTLTVTTDMGCIHSITQTIEVYPNPVVNFTFDDVCFGITANFIDVSNVTTGNITTWDWDLDGDNVVDDNTQNPSFDYPVPGTYTVTLTVTTDNGCVGTTSKDIVIFPVPVANFNNTTECFTDATQFTDATVVTPPSTITDWAWTFGDPPAQNVQNPSHTYSAPGTYDVTLAVTSNNGCTNTTTSQVVVHPLPEPEFSATSVCFGEPTEFSDLSSILTPGNIDSWYWDFGDQTNTTQAEPSHTYAVADFYDVTLTLTSDQGCTDEITHEIEVYPLPQVDFVATETEGCQPFATNFIDQSTIPSGYSIVQWDWDLGNGSSNAQHPRHPYPLDGVYSISLTATSNEGCQSTLTLTDYITVNPKPKAGFEPTPQPTDIIFPYVTFNNLASTDVVDWVYFFGDGSQSSEESPKHTYVEHGTFDTEQWVYNQYGCGDTITDVVIIDPAFTLYIPNAFTPNEDGHNDKFYARGLDIGIVDFKMRIFNRWGEQLFGSNDIDEGWDGTIHGGYEQVPDGVYLYRIDIINLEGDNLNYNGKVSLIR